MTGSGHWQVMLTVASPTWEPDSRSVPLMPGESLTSPGCRSRLFTARLCSHTSVMRSHGLTEAGSDCQSVKISVLCEPYSWLCTPRGQPARAGCAGSRDAPLESRGIISDGFSPPHQSRGPTVCLSVFLWLERERGLFCLVEERSVLQLRAHALMAQPL